MQKNLKVEHLCPGIVALLCNRLGKNEVEEAWILSLQKRKSA